MCELSCSIRDLASVDFSSSAIKFVVEYADNNLLYVRACDIRTVRIDEFKNCSCFSSLKDFNILKIERNSDTTNCVTKVVNKRAKISSDDWPTNTN